jgi:uncharacterized protein (TIGR02453 family)
MTVAVSPGERFAGFPEEGVQFLLELQAEQNRAWFKAHQADFVRLCRRPLELFMEELKQRLLETYPGLQDVEPHIFRIQRDTRFARDKTPYKTDVSAYLPTRVAAESPDPHGHVPGIYVSFGLDEELIALGCWHLPPELLTRYRAAVDHPKTGPEIQSIVDKLQKTGFGLSAMETLKRVPPPYSKDHPRAELLKHKGLAVHAILPDGLASTPGLLDWAEERLRHAAPLTSWLDRVLFG